VLATKFSVVGTGTNHLERIPDGDQDSIATLREGIVEALNIIIWNLNDWSVQC
jgi:hypothetical protein